MDMYEKINHFINKKNLTKREFSKKLRDLEPKLKSTGEIPTEKTIYKYLDGSISLKIELIPYIAEVLQITEQELFTNDKQSRKKFFYNILKTANDEEIEIIKNKFNLSTGNSSLVKEPNSPYNKTNTLHDELIALLPYAPNPLIKNIIEKLKEIKELNDNI